MIRKGRTGQPREVVLRRLVIEPLRRQRLDQFDRSRSGEPRRTAKETDISNGIEPARHRRTNFTDAQKATIYARDRATCAFSGISLWIPDRGLTPEWEEDWADHLRPSARGGLSSIDNGACVSSTFNAKKGDNARDSLCFFLEGHITRAYVSCFGLPGDEVLADLARRAALVPADWWFNRALSKALLALSWRASLALGRVPTKRDDEYWIRSALRFHARWRRLRVSGSYASRGLLPSQLPFGTDRMIALETVESEAQLREWLETLWPGYLATSRLLAGFDALVLASERERLLDRAMLDPAVNPETVSALQALSSVSARAA